MHISVIIPVYKKVNQFIHNLRINVKYLINCEIIVVNDDPSESIKEQLQEFSQIKLIENNQNLGFASSVNTGVNESSGQFILLLNSDVVLLDNSFMKAVKHFENNKLFAVSFAQKEKNGEIVGKNKIFWKNGFVQHSKASDLSTGLNGWAEGGSCLINAEKFKDLNGFDSLYNPFYWEDIDLSYRAWKKGYSVLFDSSIEVEHHHESTIGSFFKKNQIKSIAYRNQLLFIWKNIASVKLIFSHIFHLKLLILKSIVKSDTVFLNGFGHSFLLLV